MVSTRPVGAFIVSQICHKQFSCGFILGKIYRKRKTLQTARMRGADHILAIAVLCLYFLFSVVFFISKVKCQVMNEIFMG